jgi:hypothetical protein
MTETGTLVAALLWLGVTLGCHAGVMMHTGVELILMISRSTASNCFFVLIKSIMALLAARARHLAGAPTGTPTNVYRPTRTLIVRRAAEMPDALKQQMAAAMQVQ